MKFVNSFLLLLLFSFSLYAQAEINIFHKESRALSNGEVKKRVLEALEIPEETDKYVNIGINVYDDHFVTYLFSATTYEASCIRLNESRDGKLTVIDGYIDDQDRSDNVPCATCPDESIEVLVSGSFTDANHVSRKYVKKAYEDLMDMGIKVKELGGAEENAESIRNWLSCKNLKLWGRIGHGSPNAVSFAGRAESLTKSDFASMDLTGKILILNSCYVHNANFVSSVIYKAGAKFFSGGDNVTLLQHESEEVWYNIVYDGVAFNEEFGGLVTLGNADLNPGNEYGFTRHPGLDEVYYTDNLVLDDFETNDRKWRLVGDFLKGWGIVGPGNSSHTITRLEQENPLDPTSEKVLKWQSKLGTKDVITIHKDTKEKGISEYRFTQINTPPNFRDCEGITFQMRSENGTTVELVASPAYAQIYNASVTVGPDWKTYKIPFSSFEPNEYWVPDDPVMQPEKIQVIGFEVNGTGITKTVYIDNIELYSSKPITRGIKLKSGANGSITKSVTPAYSRADDSLKVIGGGSVTVNIVPDAGYQVFDVIVDGVHQGPVTTYTFNSVIDDHTIEATFVEEGLTIHSIQTADSIKGYITPIGKVSVLDGGEQLFSFLPYSHERVKDVIVNGDSKGASNEYTFTNVTSNQTLDVKFELIQWSIDINCDENIEATPTGTQLITDSTGFMVTFTPKSMYNINDVVVNGVSQGTITEYVIPSVNMDYTIEVTSKPNLLIEDAQDGDKHTNGGGFWFAYGDHLVTAPGTPGNSASAMSNVVDSEVSGNRYMAWDFTLGDTQAKNEAGDDIGNWVGCGFGLAQFNLKGYKGITFRAKATASIEGSVNIGCNETPYMKSVSFDTEWQTYTLPFDEFTVSPWAPEPITPFSDELIKTIGLEFNNFLNKGVALQIAIDDIQAYTDSTVHIIAAEAEKGIIYPHGNNVVIEGYSQKYVMQTPANALLTDVVVNGSSEGAVEEYTFENVTTNQTIKALFDLPTYTLTASKVGEGTVSYLGDTTLNRGDTITYTFEAAAGYTLTDVVIDGESKGAITSYHFDNVVKSSTIEVTFSEDAAWSITTIADGNGSVTPGDTTVATGSTITVTITPDAHYKIDDVLLDGVSQGAVTSLPLENITANHTIVAKFAPLMWSITATVGENGTITPVDTSIIDGSSATVTITPNAHYQIADVLLDGVSQGAVTSLLLENVTANHTVSATFAPIVWSITATAGGNGTITPADTSVIDGGTATMTITPNAHYQIADVLLDGVSQGAVSSLLLENVTASHTVTATFAPIVWDITVTQGDNGTITPADTSVIDGSSVNFTIVPDSNYITIDVLVDGVSHGPIESYLFENVTDHSTITAVFDIDTHSEFIEEEKYSGIVSLCPSIITVDDKQGIKFFYNSDEPSDIEVVIFDKIGGVIYQNVHSDIRGNGQHFGEYKINRVLEKGIYLAVFKISQKNKAILVRKQIGIKK